MLILKGNEDNDDIINDNNKDRKDHCNFHINYAITSVKK